MATKFSDFQERTRAQTADTDYIVGYRPSGDNFRIEVEESRDLFQLPSISEDADNWVLISSSAAILNKDNLLTLEDDGAGRITEGYFGIQSAAFSPGDEPGDVLGVDTDGNLTVDIDTFVVDAVNDRVGINVANPTYNLDVDGIVRFDVGTDAWIFAANGAVLGGAAGSRTTLRWTSFDLEIGNTGSASVELYHNAIQRLKTTADGIDIKGGILIDEDGVKTTVDNNTAVLFFEVGVGARITTQDGSGTKNTTTVAPI